VDNALNAIAKEMGHTRRTDIIRVGQPFSTLQARIQIDKTGHSVREALSSTTRRPSRNIVVGTTLARSVLIRDLLSEKFDIVAVDEASMAPLPMLFYASSLARNKVMAIGDFKQLPPIAMNDDSDLVKRWLKRDIFEEAGIVSCVERRQHDARMVMLREQYRLDPRICQLLN
jgi:superfamily I DNA and/or RNA helicase